MAKVLYGRLDGLDGMTTFTAADVHALADDYALRSRIADPADDLRWLRRREKRLRCLAEQKHRRYQQKADERRRQDRGGGR
ncbi:MAG: hypothetical protein K2X82_25300 [Gemmataceae bacterium]|nr:hypothetical protein [Gemmataceae bacterium]